VLPPLVLAGAFLGARRRDALDADPAARRARTALPRAHSLLAEARMRLDAGDRPGAAERLHQALAGYVADRARRPAGGMTAADVADALAGCEVLAAQEVVDALRAAEAARFGGSPAAIPDALDAAAGWLRSLDEGWRP